MSSDVMFNWMKVQSKSSKQKDKQPIRWWVSEQGSVWVYVLGSSFMLSSLQLKTMLAVGC